MWIMISGPYRSGSKDPVVWQQNLDAMNLAAYEVFKLGHVPVIGVNFAKPIIDLKGEECYDEIMMPLSMKTCERCDAVLRIGGASKGADMEVDYFEKKSLPVYRSIEEIPY